MSSGDEIPSAFMLGFIVATVFFLLIITKLTVWWTDVNSGRVFIEGQRSYQCRMVNELKESKD